MEAAALAALPSSQVRLVQVSALPAPVYGFDGRGYTLFRVERLNENVLGASEFVAVHKQTLRAVYLGRVGAE